MAPMSEDIVTQFIGQVRDTIESHGLLPRAAGEAQAREPVIVGVSGGPDSVALLHAMAALAAKDLAIAPVVAHLHHGLRSAADADQAFVEDLARKLALDCEVGRADVRGEAAQQGIGIEEAARLARRRFLADVARRRGARRVALAHQADDRVETVLFHILRGTGIEGLAALGPRSALAPEAPWPPTMMRHSVEKTPFFPSHLAREGRVRGSLAPCRQPSLTPSPSPAEGRGEPPIEIIRPLIELRRADILAYLEAAGLEYREDESNQTSAYTRNRLRRLLLPAMREGFNPKVDEAILRLAQQAEGVREVLDEALEATWCQIVREMPPPVCHSEPPSGGEESRPAADVCVPRPALPGRANADENAARRDETRRGTQAIIIDADGLAAARPWMQGAILRRAVERLGGGLKHLSAERMRAVLAALLSGPHAGPVELPGGLAALRRREAIRIGRAEDH